MKYLLINDHKLNGFVELVYYVSDFKLYETPSQLCEALQFSERLILRQQLNS